MIDDSKSGSNEDNSLDSILTLVDKVGTHSKIVTECTEIVKGVVSKDPCVFDDTYVEYFLKAHFGESKYDIFKKIYLDLLGK